MTQLDGGQVTRILARVRERDTAARDQLMQLLYSELRALASSYMHQQSPAHTLQATSLVSEVYLRLFNDRAGQVRSFEDREHFFAVAACAMRQVLTDHARRKRAAKRGPEWQQVTLSTAFDANGTTEVDVVAVDDALNELAGLDDRKHQVVQLRFFAGMTTEMIARVLDVSVATVESDWRFGRAWLAAKLKDPGA